MLLAVLLLAGSAAHADVVQLAGGGILRAVAVNTSGVKATVELISGGSLTVPIRSIESITPEPLTGDLCAASPYRCQDRALLLTRRFQARAAAAAVEQQRRQP